MIQDFQDNLVLSDQIKNLSGWITLLNNQYDYFIRIQFYSAKYTIYRNYFHVNPANIS